MGPSQVQKAGWGDVSWFPGVKQVFPQYLQDQGHPQQEQPQIQREIGQDPVGMPGLRQEQFEDFQTQGMDKDHVNGLEPQYEQMPEPERPDGEHQQQQIGQIAEIIQELEGAGFKFHEPPAKKTGQQDKFEQENVTNARTAGNGGWKAVQWTGKGNSGDRPPAAGTRRTGTGAAGFGPQQEHLRNSLFFIMPNFGKDVKRKKARHQSDGLVWHLELLIGFEPTTLSLRMRCSTS